ncbi:hypothetical protein F441_01674 [Phytophthora nicotianae CJ01A1]|uniref:Uncharacterized protein n=1 Tax=Phytophthora nicotianae CJ01A1 TaxID=1317063 RepID=W2XRF3_PHYNI|nr:hypothetical protein F441_01674 [Phytophthora nicotianae CJ01A1]
MEKLVHIFFNAKNVDEEELDEYTHFEDALVNVEDDEDQHNTNQDEAYVYF